MFDTVDTIPVVCMYPYIFDRLAFCVLAHFEAFLGVPVRSSLFNVLSSDLQYRALHATYPMTSADPTSFRSNCFRQCTMSSCPSNQKLRNPAVRHRLA